MNVKKLILLNCSAGEGNGTPLQYSCLENPMDGGAWQAAVHGVANSWTWLSDFTFTFHFPLSRIEEGNGSPLQCSCLENPRDGEAWWAAIYRVTQSQTQLKWCSSSSSSSIMQKIPLQMEACTNCIQGFVNRLRCHGKVYILSQCWLQVLSSGCFLNCLIISV